MLDTLSDFLVLSNFLTWVRDTQTLDWLSMSTQLTVDALVGGYLMFLLYSLVHIIHSNMSVLGIRKFGNVLWYRFFWLFLLTSIHISVIAYWIWRRNLRNSETKRRIIEEERLLSELEKEILSKVKQ